MHDVRLFGDDTGSRTGPIFELEDMRLLLAEVDRERSVGFGKDPPASALGRTMTTGKIIRTVCGVVFLIGLVGIPDDLRKWETLIDAVEFDTVRWCLVAIVALLCLWTWREEFRRVPGLGWLRSGDRKRQALLADFRCLREALDRRLNEAGGQHDGRTAVQIGLLTEKHAALLANVADDLEERLRAVDYAIVALEVVDSFPTAMKKIRDRFRHPFRVRLAVDFQASGGGSASGKIGR